MNIDFQIDEGDGRGHLDIRGERRPPLLCSSRPSSHLDRSFEWPEAAFSPVLDLVFVCPACQCEQTAASSEDSGAPPVSWVCAHCSQEHRQDWACNATSALIKGQVCYFCDQPILTLETIGAGDFRFDPRGFSQCYDCLRIKEWTKTWGVLRAVARSIEALLPWAIALHLVDMLAGGSKEVGSSYVPCAARLLFWKMIPPCRIPLTLDYRWDHDDLGN